MATALVVGANRGIGLELCRHLQARGHSVIATCRKSSAELESLRVRVEVGADVASDEAIRGLGQRLAGVSLDLLIHNAGILERHSADHPVIDVIRRQFEVNTLGILRVAAALMPLLCSPGGRLALITSRMGSIGDNTSGGSYGYRMSKAAANMAGVCLAHDLRKRGIAVAMIHPGFVRTDMTRQQGDVSAAEAAAGILQRIDQLDLSNTGTFWHANGQVLPW
jgi:NAD(P)-dependent dehydrogenase (short-subunit alcohol dehydrogenase family)